MKDRYVIAIEWADGTQDLQTSDTFAQVLGAVDIYYNTQELSKVVVKDRSTNSIVLDVIVPTEK